MARGRHLLKSHSFVLGQVVNLSEPQFSYLYNGEVTLISEFIVRIK